MTTKENVRKFEVGAVVQLKSGGSPMAVQGYSMVDEVMVAWNDGKKTQREKFAEDSLKLYEQSARKVAW